MQTIVYLIRRKDHLVDLVCMWETARFLAADFWYPTASVSLEFQAWERAQSWGTAVSIKCLKIFQYQTKKADSPDLACHHPEVEMSYFLGRGTTCPMFKKKKKNQNHTNQVHDSLPLEQATMEAALWREQVFNRAFSAPDSAVLGVPVCRGCCSRP